MTMSLPKVPKSKSKKTARPYNRYNIYFILERENLIVGLGGSGKWSKCSKDDVNEPVKDESGNALKLPPFPPRFAHLDVPANWCLPSKQKRRPHRRTHGVATFQELAQSIARSWKTIDEETLKFCTTVEHVSLYQDVILIKLFRWRYHLTQSHFYEHDVFQILRQRQRQVELSNAEDLAKIKYTRSKAVEIDSQKQMKVKEIAHIRTNDVKVDTRLNEIVAPQCVSMPGVFNATNASCQLAPAAAAARCSNAFYQLAPAATYRKNVDGIIPGNAGVCDSSSPAVMIQADGFCHDIGEFSWDPSKESLHLGEVLDFTSICISNEIDNGVDISNKSDTTVDTYTSLVPIMPAEQQHPWQQLFQNNGTALCGQRVNNLDDAPAGEVFDAATFFETAPTAVSDEGIERMHATGDNLWL